MRKYKHKELTVEPLVGKAIIGGSIGTFDINSRMDKRLAVLGAGSHISDSVKNETLSNFNKAQEWCESPIEIQALKALLTAPYHGFLSCPIPVHNPKIEPIFPEGDLIVICQFGIARYRLDFAIIVRAGDKKTIVAVECDGDEFHNESGEAYRNDRHRDAYLENFGIKTFRIAGCDLHANAFQAIIPVTNFLSDWKTING